ncbi:helix-turn-helix domain-containing protein [Aliivibrio logei]|uniref:helix-turn-helix domain-containing protein n=1 Tax=Aliivibrio logei TaxID=688 RepID=UPI0003A9EAC4|nr:helix-turn-helix transcriptional regulator [Aliivibrio logei]
MEFGKRIKSIIKEERYSQREFAVLIDIPLGTLEGYLSERAELSGKALGKIANHEKFKKYTLWLMTGEVNSDAGQVCPAFSTQEKCGLTIGNGDTQKKA